MKRSKCLGNGQMRQTVKVLPHMVKVRTKKTDAPAEHIRHKIPSIFHFYFMNISLLEIFLPPTLITTL